MTVEYFLRIIFVILAEQRVRVLLRQVEKNVLDDDRVNLLKDKIRFSFWEKLDENHTVIRFVTSWSTSEEDMQALEEALEVI